jgi:peptidoglycan/xylan/chitin deacetylase (PgdA/CDA1 family)
MVVMYHHVHGPRTPHLAGLHGPTQDEFARQVRTIQESYVILNYRELLDGIQGKRSLPEKCALLTFDDGTIDHYECVFPILVSLGVSGLFFVITDSVSNRALTPVHIRHLLARKLSEARFRQEVQGRLADLGGEAEIWREVPIERATQAYRWDDVETARFKYALNFSMPVSIRNQILKDIFERYVGNCLDWGDSVYLTWAQLREMRGAGMYVGGHSHRHEALTRLSEPEIERELALCHATLTSALGLEDIAFSYPFGKPEHFSPIIIQALIKHGFTIGFTNVQGINGVGAVTNRLDHYTYRRLDPRDLKAYLPLTS